jgi:hypothetical protein
MATPVRVHVLYNCVQHSFIFDGTGLHNGEVVCSKINEWWNGWFQTYYSETESPIKEDTHT